MVFKKLNYYLFFIGLLTLLPINLIKPKSSYSKFEKEAYSVYKFVYDHYLNILQIYYDIEKAGVIEKPYFINKLVNSIIFHMQQDKFYLYGNFFSRMFRNLTTYPSYTPLKKFDTTFLEDAIGHLSKYQSKLYSSLYINRELKDLITSLQYIRTIVQNTDKYKLEESALEINKLKSEITNLRIELNKEREKCQRLSRELLIYKKNIDNSL